MTIDSNLGYLMLKPGWGKSVYPQGGADNQFYDPKVWQIAQDVLRLHQLVPYIGILTCLTADQLRVMYPLYKDSITFDYLVDFYSKNVSLVLLVWDKMQRGDCVERILDLKKDYAASTRGNYRSGLKELRRIPNNGTNTPDLSLLAKKLKDGTSIIARDGRDLTPALVKNLYGTGAVVHSPSSLEECENDLIAITGQRYDFFQGELDNLIEDTPDAEAMIRLYYQNVKSKAFYTLLSNNTITNYASEKICVPYFMHANCAPWRQLGELNVIDKDDFPEYDGNLDTEYKKYWQKKALAP